MWEGVNLRTFRVRMHCKGGGQPPPPSRAPNPSPATVPLTATASFNGICNRQKPPPTALAPRNAPRGGQTLWPQKHYERPSFRKNVAQSREQDTHFIIFAMALGPLWPFALLSHCIRRGAWGEWMRFTDAI